MNIHDILRLYPQFNRVYGPYIRKDGRKIINLTGNGCRKTISYPKAIMEIHLGRRLANRETVDHIDRDFTNDNIENLQILDLVEHIKLDAVRLKDKTGVCLWCNTEFVLSVEQYKNQYRKNKKTGPFCSRTCSGQYGSYVQNGGEIIERRVYYQREYYQVDK